jgi:hypothetical protein
MIRLIAFGGIMSRLMQLIIIAVSLMVLIPAQAAFNVKTGVSVCQVFSAEEDSKDGKKKETDKKEGEQEEEPDCE